MGRTPWLTYYRALIAAFTRIADYPEAGRDRNLFAPDLRSVQCEQHLIFYAHLAPPKDQVVILRILHAKRYWPALMYYDDLDGG